MFLISLKDVDFSFSWSEDLETELSMLRFLYLGNLGCCGGIYIYVSVVGLMDTFSSLQMDTSCTHSAMLLQEHYTCMGGGVLKVIPKTPRLET